eukprot:gene14435-14558_t
MIPGRFDYHRPASIAQAVQLLSTLGDEARPLAGGHSLIPMMKLRMASPEHLIDLSGISELKSISDSGTTITIGAMVTQNEIIRSELLAAKLPILRETSLQIADPQIRYVGTLGGNVANGDPGNDMPALMMCLDALYHVAGPDGARSIKAREFYHGAYDTALTAGELVTAIEVPVPGTGHGHSYEKLKRKIGDYATAAAAVVLTLADGKVATCAIGLTNLADTPLLAEAAAALLIGKALTPELIAQAASAAEAITSPASDGRGPAIYRTKMAGVMVTRALNSAAQRATA